jgi:hypothetical protein
VWERSLFPAVKVIDLPAPLEALTDNLSLFLASDGGTIPLKGSFPVHFDPRLHLRTFYQLHFSRMTLTLVCDSLSLLDWLSASRKLTRVVPRRFLFSEADAEMAILDTFRALKADLVLQHVESHQDTKYPNRSSTWKATKTPSTQTGRQRGRPS